MDDHTYVVVVRDTAFTIRVVVEVDSTVAVEVVVLVGKFKQEQPDEMTDDLKAFKGAGIVLACRLALPQTIAVVTVVTVDTLTWAVTVGVGASSVTAWA